MVKGLMSRGRIGRKGTIVYSTVHYVRRPTVHYSSAIVGEQGWNCRKLLIVLSGGKTNECAVKYHCTVAVTYGIYF